MTTSQAPVVVELVLNNTEENRRRLSLLSRLEKWGDKVKITLEIVK